MIPPMRSYRRSDRLNPVAFSLKQSYTSLMTNSRMIGAIAQAFSMMSPLIAKAKRKLMMRCNSSANVRWSLRSTLTIISVIFFMSFIRFYYSPVGNASPLRW